MLQLFLNLFLCGIISDADAGAESKCFWLRQSINVPAIKQLGVALFKPQLMVPRLQLASVNDMDVDSLYAMGARYIVFDKDNTLAIPFQDEIEPSLQNKVDQLKAGPFAGRMAILSNSAGSCDDDDFRRATAAEKGLGFPVIRHVYKKPKCLDEVVMHFGAHASADQICVVGDRLLTDVMFGNMHGMVTVLVNPLSNRRDHVVAVAIRSVERFLLLPVAKIMYALLRAVGACP